VKAYLYIPEMMTEEVLKTSVQWDKTKENHPITTGEGIGGLCLSAVRNLGDEHLNS